MNTRWRQMKTYTGCYDGRDHHFVAAPTKKAAYEAMKKVVRGVGGYARWDRFTSVTGNRAQIDFSMLHLCKVCIHHNPHTKSERFEVCQ